MFCLDAVYTLVSGNGTESQQSDLPIVRAVNSTAPNEINQCSASGNSFAKVYLFIIIYNPNVQPNKQKQTQRHIPYATRYTILTFNFLTPTVIPPHETSSI